MIVKTNTGEEVDLSERSNARRGMDPAAGRDRSVLSEAIDLCNAVAEEARKLATHVPEAAPAVATPALEWTEHEGQWWARRGDAYAVATAEGWGCFFRGLLLRQGSVSELEEAKKVGGWWVDELATTGDALLALLNMLQRIFDAWDQSPAGQQAARASVVAALIEEVPDGCKPSGWRWLVYVVSADAHELRIRDERFHSGRAHELFCGYLATTLREVLPAVQAYALARESKTVSTSLREALAASGIALDVSQCDHPVVRLLRAYEWGAAWGRPR